MWKQCWELFFQKWQRSNIVDMVYVKGVLEGEHNKEREEKETEKMLEGGKR